MIKYNFRLRINLQDVNIKAIIPLFWDIIKYGFMSVMLKQTRDVKALIVVY